MVTMQRASGCAGGASGGSGAGGSTPGKTQRAPSGWISGPELSLTRHQARLKHAGTAVSIRSCPRRTA
eukprot:453722-Alexandrium_andersonii.AAC.1